MPDAGPDAYAPPQIAQRVSSAGVAKASANAPTILILGVLGGAFIALGSMFYAVVITGSELGYGPTRLLGGFAFSLGLVLVVIGGAELFTGNNLIAMAWASRLVSTRDVLRNWVIVYVGNFVGALGTFALAWLAGVHDLPGVGDTLATIGERKAGYSPLQVFALGVLCNGLVCLAVWLSYAGRAVVDRVVGIVFPVTAFVAVGLEHCVANFFYLPYAWALGALDSGGLKTAAVVNLGIVTAGNIVGGTLLVAGVYWLAYLRNPERD